MLGTEIDNFWNIRQRWLIIVVIVPSFYLYHFSPKYAVAQIKKKMISQNPHTALYALMVLESVVKNCGAPLHEEIANKANCESFATLVQTTTHENVRNKMLELIQTWSYAFRSAYKYRGIKVCNLISTSSFLCVIFSSLTLCVSYRILWTFWKRKGINFLIWKKCLISCLHLM